MKLVPGAADLDTTCRVRQGGKLFTDGLQKNQHVGVWLLHQLQDLDETHGLFPVFTRLDLTVAREGPLDQLLPYRGALEDLKGAASFREGQLKHGVNIQEWQKPLNHIWIPPELFPCMVLVTGHGDTPSLSYITGSCWRLRRDRKVPFQWIDFEQISLPVGRCKGLLRTGCQQGG